MPNRSDQRSIFSIGCCCCCFKITKATFVLIFTTIIDLGGDARLEQEKHYRCILYYCIAPCKFAWVILIQKNAWIRLTLSVMQYIRFISFHSYIHYLLGEWMASTVHIRWNYRRFTNFKSMDFYILFFSLDTFMKWSAKMCSSLCEGGEKSFVIKKIAGKEVITKTCITHSFVYSFCEIDSLNSFIRQRCVFVSFIVCMRIEAASCENVDGFYSLMPENS